MDSDLQHPPEIVPQLIARWRDGFDIVNAERTNRAGETPLQADLGACVLLAPRQARTGPDAAKRGRLQGS